MGPLELAPGTGMDVRPHPHIGLATVTYLFEGELLHRDSLGSRQPIRPGDVNWMTAGRGIVHSERSDDETRRNGARMHGIQSWVALPLEHEETEPSFAHHPKSTLPTVELEGAMLRVVAGEVFGMRAPTHTLSPLFYVHATLAPGASVMVPDDEERGVYVVEGSLEIDADAFGAGRLVVLEPGREIRIRATAETRAMLLGGASLGERHIYWNLVSSSKERIERAKEDWRERRFPLVPGDEREFIALPPD
jgi:redox-sensitive bicupin YhaK (pirin superfamily)